MKLFITGASSTLGKNLTTELLKIENVSIRLLEHHTPVKRESCQTFKADIQDVESLNQACSGIDLVIHLAALTHSKSMKAYFEVNEKGTEKLIAACQKNKVTRFIYISSTAATQKAGEYGVSKLRGEKKVKSSNLDWVILRLSEVYGPEMDEGMGKLFSWVKRFPVIPVIGDGSCILSPVYIDDIVRAIVEIVKNDSLRNMALNLCGPEEMTMNEVIDRFVQFHKVKRKKIHLPLWFARLGISLLSVLNNKFAFPDQIPRLLCDKDFTILAAQNAISYNSKKFEEGLRYYKSAKP
tara:strand:+ start:407 stop:1291 length:885 start_codon:yes stop_codon:yes gene_type:complete